MHTSKILQKLATLETERAALFAFLQQYSHEVHNQRPIKGGWSAIQTVQHLLAAETASLHYLQKKTTDLSRSHTSGFMANMRSLLLKSLLSMPIKFKAPAIVAVVPESGVLAEVNQQWSETRAAMHSLLSGLSEEDCKKELFSHPIAGKLNLYQMLDFMQAHIQHHLPQIQRAVKG